ncbi:hypothetical protein O3M35_002527 [Rhynocoris fuscipes]|uniref:Right handed beta helix domain-containing protein n=1 Tax=Rhynocoris fuscipes TaxID=488301 RepID=A0AAW1CKM3_9HEMI
MLEMKVGDFPENLASVEISGGRELRFSTEVFSRHPLLEVVKIIRVPKIFVREHSFANMTTDKLVRFEFTDAASLILEGQSWKNVAGPISGLIARVDQVIIQGQAFSWLNDITIVDVNKLELLERAFQLEKPRINPELASTKITLERVHIENLCHGTFQSLVSEVKLISSDVKRVRTDAFNAIMLDNVLIDNTTLHRIEDGAFSDKTLIKTLTMKYVEVHQLNARGFLSAFSNLIIAHSRFFEIHSGGMNVTVASVTLVNNSFTKIHSNGISFTQWSSLSLVNNTFRKIDTEAFVAPLASSANTKNVADLAPGQHSLIRMPEFNFTGNFMHEIADSAFDFSIADDCNIVIDNNFFFFKCHCNMSGRVKAIMTGKESLVYETGYCSVDRTLSKCFHLPEGFVKMWNFTEQICATNERILCEEVQQRDAAVIPPRSVSGVITSAVVPGLHGNSNENDISREKRLLFTVLALVALSALIVTTLTGLMWICRKGYCSKARRLILPSTNSLIDYISRMFSNGGVTPAGSISRLSVHEYAELQRKMEEAKVDEELGVVLAATTAEDIPLEDKATQTLPEELTQELLQSLKEKLNDPENYGEARDMIEHLYDLIKVEENCNRNYRESTAINVDELDREENVYDVIRPKRYSPPKSKKEVVSIGTRAPSPDKLLPYTKRGIINSGCATMVADYMEPRDRKVHTYSELPHRPDLLQPALANTTITSDYNEPSDTKVHLYTEVPAHVRLANRPLPAHPSFSAPTGANTKHNKSTVI